MGLLTHHFYDHPLVPLAVEFGIEDSLPGPKSSLPAVIGTMTSW